MFPPNVRTIGKNVLASPSDTNTLKTVIVGEYVQSIDDYFCRYRSSMQKVIIYAKTPPADATLIFRRGTAQALNANFKIYVPDDSINAYKSAPSWDWHASRYLPLSQLEG